MKTDPWLAIADPIDEHQPAQQPMGAASASAQQPGASPASAPSPANDSFDAVAEPVGPAEVVDTQQSEGGFADELPDQPAATMAPEDEAHYLDLFRNHKDDEALRFIASKGFTVLNFADAVADRDKFNHVANSLAYHKPVPLDDDGATGAFARGIADVPTMGFSDELHGLAEGVKKAVTGKQSEQGFWHDVAVADDVYSGRVDRDEAEHPLARIGGQLLGGLAIPLTYEGVGLRAGTLAMKEARAAGGITAQEALKVGRRAAAKAVTKAMTRDGVIVGGAHGVGSGEGVAGRVGEGALEAGLGASAGMVAGKIGQVIVPRLAARAAAARAQPLTEEQDLIKAADRAGIDVLPADVGGPVTRRASSWTAQTMFGGRPIINASEKMQGQAKAERDRIAASIGEAMDPEAAGQQGISGAQKYITESGQEARKFYSAAEKESAGLKVPTPKALTVLQEQINALAETPGGSPGLSTLQGIHDALLDGKASVAGIRRMRTVIRDQFMKDGLAGSDLERRVNMVTDAAAEDVRDGLSAAGKPDAAANFAAGDAAWKTRARTIQTVIQPLIGKPDAAKSGEAVIKTLTADLQGNNARGVRFLKSMPPEEQGNIRASIIGALGRSAAGKQGSEGEEFSLDTFLTNWNKIGGTAKAAYFGPEGRAALNDLAKIAEGTREAQGFRNMSNTGGVVAGIATAATSLGGLPLLLKTLGTQYVLGRLLASPNFARWLARAPKAKSMPAYVDRLSRIAKAEPAIAGDILSLQQRLMEAFRAQPMRAAADDKRDSEQSPQ
jgi:hypothetical protein